MPWYPLHGYAWLKARLLSDSWRHVPLRTPANMGSVRATFLASNHILNKVLLWRPVCSAWNHTLSLEWQWAMLPPLSHLPAPLYSADPLWVTLPLQLSHGFLIALLPSSLSVPAALLLGNPWHCCWLVWPEVLLPVHKTPAADWQNVSV